MRATRTASFEVHVEINLAGDRPRHELSFQLALMSLLENVAAGLRKAASGQLDLHDMLSSSRSGNEAPSGPPAFSGYVRKQGSFVKNWKRRYMVLHDDTLFYYVSERATTKPRGFFRVTGIAYAPDLPHGLIADGTGTRRLKFTLADNDECDAWYDTLSERLHRTGLERAQSVPSGGASPPGVWHKAMSEGSGAAAFGRLARHAAANTNLKHVESAATLVSPELGAAVHEAAPVLRQGQKLLRQHEKKSTRSAAKQPRRANKRAEAEADDEADASPASDADVAADDGADSEDESISSHP
ncbi:hypothetical protein SDRG_00080 [Saprolegnia diclina VS20]|uniref:PH domain-containing protein n=1 Tax=Saprolegnia diclina (strain VS20) TaxID=1156394 RepID=T0SH73_SAPDV|nr:hypothetical protein SDRG_00080 [Saprolegnia diclina VS20]EQC42342.1 hypothetical protein SDRG_00080 [Saprolegnia diclina VS20]|eukprot:XP_008603765.1 hypothetical protein SDRG_00080 [Saprolegnia diclina VS20]